MQPLSLCQARLVGKVSKPSLELSSKNSSASVPAAARAYSWLSAKRKREDEEKEEKKKKKEEDSEERSSQKQRPCPLFKKVKEVDPAVLGLTELICSSQKYVFLTRPQTQARRHRTARARLQEPSPHLLSPNLHLSFMTFRNQLELSSPCTNSC